MEAQAKTRSFMITLNIRLQRQSRIHENRTKIIGMTIGFFFSSLLFLFVGSQNFFFFCLFVGFFFSLLFWRRTPSQARTRNNIHYTWKMTGSGSSKKKCEQTTKTSSQNRGLQIRVYIIACIMISRYKHTYLILRWLVDKQLTRTHKHVHMIFHMPESIVPIKILSIHTYTEKKMKWACVCLLLHFELDFVPFVSIESDVCWRGVRPFEYMSNGNTSTDIFHVIFQNA